MQNETRKPDWQSIRRCVELGVPPKNAAEKFGVSYDAVRQRACREKWVLPSKIERVRNELKAPDVTSGSQVNAGEIVTKTVAEMGHELKTVTLSKALTAIKRADLAALPIDSWQDAKTAFDIGLRAAGLDSQAGPAVSVIVSSSESAPLIEIDASPAPELL